MNSQIVLYKRSILAALLMSASAVLAQVNNITVLGSLDGHGIGTVQGVTLQAAASGTGHASNIGQFTYTLQGAVNLPTGISSGVFLLSFSNDDVIFGSFSGQGDTPPPNPPNPGHIVEQLTITGGTGRFQGATGSFTFKRVVDLSKLPDFESHSGTLTGTISTPSSAK